ncbi:hypothetical protein KAR91_26685, partial [Candidatus Pacearchaeota archaeon]|nr:hypothetical protein [Candidatus Pacearchaeota archaeon]
FGDTPAIDYTPDEWSFTYDIINANSGDGIITVTVYDEAGCSSEIDFHYYEDNSPPSILSVISPTHPNENLWYSNNAPIFLLESSDMSGIEGYYHELDQNPSTTTLSNYDARSSITYTDKATGIWWLHVAAKDDVGNIGPIVHWKIMIDTILPGTPEPHIISGENTMNPIFAWDDPGDMESGVSGYYWKMNHYGQYEWIDSPEVSASTNRVGFNQFYVYAVDNAGNSGQENVIQFNVDGGGISGTLVFAAAGYTINGDFYQRPVQNNEVFLYAAYEAYPGHFSVDYFISSTISDSEGRFFFPLMDSIKRPYLIGVGFNEIDGILGPLTLVEASSQMVTYTSISCEYRTYDDPFGMNWIRGKVYLDGVPTSGIEIETYYGGRITKVTDANGMFEFSVEEDNMYFKDWSKYYLRVSPGYEIVNINNFEENWLPFGLRSDYGEFDQTHYRIYITRSSYNSGCPYVGYNNGTDYIEDNNILSSCEADKEKINDVTDYFALNECPPPIDDSYILDIHEYESEISYIDKVKLATIDHDEDTMIITSIDEEIFGISNITPLTECVDSIGNDVLDRALMDDDYYINTNPGYSLYLDYIIPDDATRAILICKSRKGEYVAGGVPNPGKTTLWIQVENENGIWENMTAFAPRENWAFSAVDLFKYLGYTDHPNIRIYSTQKHDIDILGIDFDNAPQININ